LTFPELLPKNSLANPINYELEEKNELQENEMKTELQQQQEQQQPQQENENEEEQEKNEEHTYDIYTPKIFGFKIHETSQSGQRMKWLRW